MKNEEEEEAVRVDFLGGEFEKIFMTKIRDLETICM